MNLVEQVINIIKENNPHKNELHRCSRLFSEDMNSIDFILLLSKIEDKLNIEIDIEDMNDFSSLTIEDIVRIVEGKSNDR